MASAKWTSVTSFKTTFFREMHMQRGMLLPLVAMNITGFAKILVSTAFLGRLGELQLAGGALGFTFANVTGFSVLNGLCGAMEPLCGQASGARNFRLLHKTLLMSTLLLLLATVPISFLWLYVDKILTLFGQNQEILVLAKSYLLYFLPGLIVTSFLCPFKAYLSSQGITLPILFSSALALAFHVPITLILAKSKGLAGISMATWLSDLVVVILLGLYILISENGKDERWQEGGWLEQGIGDWLQLLKLSGPCCLTTCLEWWCIEILVLLTGLLRNPKEAVGVLAIVLNLDYMLYSVMLSLATCASTRVSNELGANQPTAAYQSAYASVLASAVSGFLGAMVMVAGRGFWGSLFSHDAGIIRGVNKILLLMAVVEVVNFPVAVCGGIVRGTARPWLAMYASLGGFYLVALPLGITLAFKVSLGLSGLLLGFLVGMAACLLLLLVFVSNIKWDVEASKAQRLASTPPAIESPETEEKVESTQV